MSSHGGVLALMICWANDANSTFRDQRSKLKETFETRYKFNTKEVDIPDRTKENNLYPQRFISQEVITSKESLSNNSNNNTNNLLIVYYGGHGIKEKGSKLRLSRFSTLKGADIADHSCAWSHIQEEIVLGNKTNIFIILDCCHASCAIETQYSQYFEENQLGLDALVASGIYSRSTVHYSLTTRLTSVLSNTYLKLWTKERVSTSLLSLQLAEQEKSIGYLCELGSLPNSESVELGRLFHLAPSRTVSIHRFGLPASNTGEQRSGEGRCARSSLRGTAYISVDAATNTDFETLVCCSETHSLRTGHRDTSYRDVAVNTDPATRVIDSLYHPLPSEKAEGPTPQHKQVAIPPRHTTQTGRLFTLSAPRLTRKREMAGDNIANHTTDDWFRRFHQWHYSYWDVFFARSGIPGYKVVLLSSGINHSVVNQDLAALLVAFKDFSLDMEGERNSTPRDHLGNGTHCAEVIMRLCPRSLKLYVAKITDGDGPAIMPKSIEKAVEWAVGLEVDMIIMPFGLQKSDGGVFREINKALRQNIVCIAAPGNSGGNEATCFPARMPGVIAAFSADGYGNASPFNPSPDPGQRAFTFVGENIACEWGEEEDEGKRVSGTSYSACIAASILVTYISSTRDPAIKKMLQDSLGSSVTDRLDWLNSSAGIAKLLELMSRSRDGYDYVVPWNLLTDRDGRIEDEQALRTNLVRKIIGIFEGG